MDYVSTLRGLPLWLGKQIRVRRLLGGGTNDNFLVSVGRKRYVARFQGISQKKFLGLNRPREIYNTNIAHRLGVGPKIVAYYPSRRLLLVQYQEGRVLQPAQLRQSLVLRRVVNMLKRLHAGPEFAGRFSVKSSIEHFWLIARNDKKKLPNAHQNDLSRYRRCLKIISQRKVSPRPCHVDLVAINIIRSNNRLVFIDWDYSAMADPLFELAFMSGWSRFNVANDRQMLKQYFGSVSEVLLLQFMAMKALVHLREAVWAMVQQGRSTVPFNYAAYAKKHAWWFRQVVV